MINELFFDIEFTGLEKNSDLISLGICDKLGNAFYAEFNDFDTDKIVGDWISNNVFPNLGFNNTVNYYKEVRDSIQHLYIKDDKKHIKDILLQFLSQYNTIQFISDCCHYDFVLLIDLFESALSLPKNINPYCHDINYDIAKYLHISEFEAFNYNREKLVYIINEKNNIDKKQHNALINAFDIATIYIGCNNIH